jgi:hypothetical protein
MRNTITVSGSLVYNERNKNRCRMEGGGGQVSKLDKRSTMKGNQVLSHCSQFSFEEDTFPTFAIAPLPSAQTGRHVVSFWSIEPVFRHKYIIGPAPPVLRQTPHFTKQQQDPS